MEKIFWKIKFKLSIITEHKIILDMHTCQVDSSYVLFYIFTYNLKDITWFVGQISSSKAFDVMNFWAQSIFQRLSQDKRKIKV